MAAESELVEIISEEMHGNGESHFRFGMFELWAALLSKRESCLKSQQRGNAQPKSSVVVYKPTTMTTTDRPHETAISLGLIENGRFYSSVVADPVAAAPRMELPPGESSFLKVDLAIGFLNITKRVPKDWEALCRSVVPNPRNTAKMYEIDEHCYNDEEIQCFLTLDAIFLACFLLFSFRKSRSEMGSIVDVFNEQPRQIIEELSLQILRPDKQIPLELIRNVFTVMVEEKRLGANIQSGGPIANIILDEICAAFVEGNGFPRMKLPSFRELKVLRELDLESSNGISTLNDRLRCEHLLHCQAEAIWGSANPPGYVIQSCPRLAKFFYKVLDLVGSRLGRIEGSDGDGALQVLEDELKSDLLRVLDPQYVKDADGRDADAKSANDLTCGQIFAAVFMLLVLYLRIFIGYLWERLLVHLKRSGRASTDDSEQLRIPLVTRLPTILSHKASALPTAKELHQYGISIKGHHAIFPKFERRTLQFWRATLYLPELRVLGKDTKRLWRYFLEFEERWGRDTGIYDSTNEKCRETVELSHKFSQHPPMQVSGVYSKLIRHALIKYTPHPTGRLAESPRRKPFLSFLRLMDDLINTEADVEILTAGSRPVIITHSLGDYTAVAQLFNNVTEGYSGATRYDGLEWVHLIDEISKFHNDPSRRQIVEFVNSKCKPWVLVSIFVASLLLAASALQTVYTVQGYYHPHS